jgi:hypothetical protein
MARYVPRDAAVFFTADDDSFYPTAKKRWGERLLTSGAGVFKPWSSGGKVDPASLGDADEAAMLKAFVDWFALQRAARIVYTYQSSFGKTAAEATDAPNLDVNFTRCRTADERWGALPSADGASGAAEADDEPPWLAAEWANAAGVVYDTSWTKLLGGGARDEL